jgi:hypothetical protein
MSFKKFCFDRGWRKILFTELEYIATCHLDTHIIDTDTAVGSLISIVQCRLPSKTQLHAIYYADEFVVASGGLYQYLGQYPRLSQSTQRSVQMGQHRNELGSLPLLQDPGSPVPQLRLLHDCPLSRC